GRVRQGGIRGRGLSGRLAHARLGGRGAPLCDHGRRAAACRYGRARMDRARKLLAHWTEFGSVSGAAAAAGRSLDKVGCDQFDSSVANCGEKARTARQKFDTVSDCNSIVSGKSPDSLCGGPQRVKRTIALTFDSWERTDAGRSAASNPYAYAPNRANPPRPSPTDAVVCDHRHHDPGGTRHPHRCGGGGFARYDLRSAGRNPTAIRSFRSPTRDTRPVTVW